MNCWAHSDMRVNMVFILLPVKVGLIVDLMSFHFWPFSRSKFFPKNGSMSGSVTFMWSTKWSKSFTVMLFMRSRSFIRRLGTSNWNIP